MKKLLFTAHCLLLTTFLQCRPAVKMPEIRLIGLQAQDLDISGFTILAKLEIRNRNPFAIDLNEIHYNLWVEGNKLGDCYSAGVRVEKRGLVNADFPLRVEYYNLPQAAIPLLLKENCEYRITGSGQLKTPVGRVPLPLRLSGRFTPLKDISPLIRALLESISLNYEVEGSQFLS